MNTSPLSFNRPNPNSLKLSEKIKEQLDVLLKQSKEFHGLDEDDDDELIYRQKASWENDLESIHPEWASVLGETIHWLSVSTSEMVKAQSNGTPNEEIYKALTNSLKRVFQELKKEKPGGLIALGTDVKDFLTQNTYSLGSAIENLRDVKTGIVYQTENRFSNLERLLSIRNQASVCSAYILEALPEFQRLIETQSTASDMRLAALKDTADFVLFQEEAGKNRRLQRSKSVVEGLSQRFKEHLITGTASMELLDRSLSSERQSFNQFNLMFEEGLSQIALIQNYKNSQKNDELLSENQSELTKIIENNTVSPRSDIVPSGKAMENSLQERLARRRFVIEPQILKKSGSAPKPVLALPEIKQLSLNVVGTLVLMPAEEVSTQILIENFRKTANPEDEAKNALITGDFIFHQTLPPREVKKFLGFNRVGSLGANASQSQKRLINMLPWENENLIQDINTIMADPFFRINMSMLQPHVEVSSLDHKAYSYTATDLRHLPKQDSPSFLSWLTHQTMAFEQGVHLGPVVLDMAMSDNGGVWRTTVPQVDKMMFAYNLASGWYGRTLPKPLEALRIFELNYQPLSAHIEDYQGYFRFAKVGLDNAIFDYEGVRHFMRLSKDLLAHKSILNEEEQALLQYKIDLWVLEILRNEEHMLEVFQKDMHSKEDFFGSLIENTTRPEVILKINEFILKHAPEIGPMLMDKQHVHHVVVSSSIKHLDDFACTLLSQPLEKSQAWTDLLLNQPERFGIEEGMTKHMELLSEINEVKQGASLKLKTLQNLFNSASGGKMEGALLWAFEEFKNNDNAYSKQEVASPLLEVMSINLNQNTPAAWEETWSRVFGSWVNSSGYVDEIEKSVSPILFAIEKNQPQWIQAIRAQKDYHASQDNEAFKKWISHNLLNDPFDDETLINNMSKVNWWSLSALNEQVAQHSTTFTVKSFALNMLALCAKSYKSDSQFFENEKGKAMIEGVAQFYAHWGLPKFFDDIENRGGLRSGNVSSNDVMKTLSNVILKMKDINHHCADTMETDELRQALFRSVSLNKLHGEEVFSQPKVQRRARL